MSLGRLLILIIFCNQSYARASPVLVLDSEEYFLTNHQLIQDLCNYTKAATLYLVTDNHQKHATPSYVSSFDKIWIRIIDVSPDLLINAIEKEAFKPILIVFFKDAYYVTSFLKQVNDNTNILDMITLVTTNIYKDRHLIKISNMSPATRLLSLSRKPITKSFHFIDIDYFYMNYVYKVVTYKHLGNWTNDYGLWTDITFDKCCYNLTGYKLNVVYVKNYLQTILHIDNGTSSMSGIIGDIFTILINDLGIILGNVYPVPNDIYGDFDKFNKTTGIFAELHHDRADFALASLVMTGSRELVVDFLFPNFNSAFIGIYKETARDDTYFFYYKPFTINSWTLIVVGLLVITLSTVLYEYLTLENNFSNAIMTQWTLNVNQGYIAEDGRTSRRIYEYTIMVMGTLLVSFYASKTVAQNSVFVSRDRFVDLNSVINDEVYHPLVLYGSAFYYQLQSTSNSEHKDLWLKVQSDMDLYTVKTNEDALLKLDCCNAVHLTSDIYIQGAAERIPNIAVTRFVVYHNWMAFALKKGSPLTRIFNQILYRLHGTGIIKLIRNRYKKRRKQRKAKPKQIKINLMTLPVIVLVVGILLSILILVIEIRTFKLESK